MGRGCALLTTAALSPLWCCVFPDLLISKEAPDLGVSIKGLGILLGKHSLAVLATWRSGGGGEQGAICPMG